MVAAAESAIGLAILVITFQIHETIVVEFRATISCRLQLLLSHMENICSLALAAV